MSYLPHTASERERMLAALGCREVDELFTDIPARLCCPQNLGLPPPLRENELWQLARSLADRNQDLDHLCCFRGAGAYDRFIPAAVAALANRAEFLTAYTPYQAEVSQGELQALWEYQSLICNLTGLDVANSSMYDGASALAESVLLATGATGRTTVLVSEALHPEYRQVVETYGATRGVTLETLPAEQGCTRARVAASLIERKQPAAVVLQSPNFFGVLEEDARSIGEFAHAHGGLLILVVDPISLAIVASPGELGADLAVGSGQGLGSPLSFGGPYFGFLAARREFLRRLPGRIVGETVDNQGRRGFVLVLQTREQHIRREKATSNICTNHALGALAAAVYLSLLGPAGLTEVATACWRNAHYLAERLGRLRGVELLFPTAPFFQEFALRLPGRNPEEVDQAFLRQGFLGPLPLSRLLSDPKWQDTYLVCATESRTREEIDRFIQVTEGVVA